MQQEKHMQEFEDVACMSLRRVQFFELKECAQLEGAIIDPEEVRSTRVQLFSTKECAQVEGELTEHEGMCSTRAQLFNMKEYTQLECSCMSSWSENFPKESAFTLFL